MRLAQGQHGQALPWVLLCGRLREPVTESGVAPGDEGVLSDQLTGR